MVQSLALLVMGVVGCSLLAVLGYGVLLALGALRTIAGRSRPRSLAEELDQVLAEILGEAGRGRAPLPSAGPARRRP